MTAQKFDTPWTPTSRPRAAAWIASALLGVGSLAACGEDDTAPVDPSVYTASLSAFTSCDSLDDYIVDAATDAFVQAYAYGYYGGRGGVDFDEGAPTSDAGGETPSDSPNEVTGTNNQEVGVDEPDLVKSDGNYMYVLQNQTVHVVEAWPADAMHEVATYELSGWGDQMFLDEDRLVVFTHVYTGEDPYWGGRGEPEPMPDVPDDEGGSGGGDVPVDPMDDGAWFSGTRVTILDVSDPSAPAEAAVFDIEGQIVNARMVDGRVYLVSRSSMYDVYDPALETAMEGLDIPELDYDATLEEREAAAETLRELVRPALAEYVATTGRDRLIPDVRTSATDRTNLFSCGEMMHPATRAGLSVLSVVGFDPQSPTVEGVGLIADGWQLYGSQEALYVAQDSRWWNWGVPTDRYTATHIHKFALNSGSPSYLASGEVDGWLLNQFSMSEHEGVLRVATTDQSNWGWGWGGDVAVDAGEGVSEPPMTDGGSTEPAEASAGSSGGSDDKTITELREDTSVDANNVFTLRQSGNELEVIGGIRGIAPTEQIFAVRFLGDTGYVVTFRQTDPLFVVDLSDPETPELRGELHIPGYSGYLHPLGDDHLIGIGRDGTDEGQILGVQLSLFDVSNPDAPTRTDTFTLGYGDGFYGWSEAEHDHHAFTFYESMGLLAIPVTLEDYSYDSDAYSHFSGLIVFDVDTDGIEEVGRVSHTMMAADRYCGDIDETDPEPVEACSSWDYPWWVNMRRSVFADNVLYAISDMGVTASTVDALDEVVAEVRY